MAYSVKGGLILAKLEAAAESGNSAWKSYAWELEKIYRQQFGDTAVTIFEQNNYQLSEERARAVEARVQRLELEDDNKSGSNGKLTLPLFMEGANEG